MGTAPAGFPTVTVEAAFGYTPSSLSPIYTDITDWVMSFQTKRGRADELQPYAAGTAAFALDNEDGRFDPTNASSPYAGQLLPMVPVRIRSVYSATTYYQFTGFMDGWSPTWPLNKQDILNVTATDAFKLLTKCQYTNPAQPQETIAVRIGEILTVSDVGFSYASSPTIVAADSLSSDALSLLQTLEETELGSCYMDEQGLLRFEERHFRSNNKLTVQAVFGDGDSGELAYDQLEPVDDDVQIINDATIDASKAVYPLVTPAHYSDTTSILTYGDAAVSKDLPFADANQAADYAYWLVQRFKTPVLRFDSLSFEPLIAGATGFPQALGRVIGDLIQVTRRTPGGNTMVEQCHIDSIAHSFDAETLDWHTVWGLSPKTQTITPWKLNDAVFSVLGTTTIFDA